MRHSGSLELLLSKKPTHLNSSHGLSRHRLYDVYKQMLRRCYNEASKDYKNYGQRGIKVYDKWLDIRTFFLWAIETGYKKGLTIKNRLNVYGWCVACTLTEPAYRGRNQTEPGCVHA